MWMWGPVADPGTAVRAEMLVTTEWLAVRLNDPKVVVFHPLLTSGDGPRLLPSRVGAAANPAAEYVEQSPE